MCASGVLAHVPSLRRCPTLCARLLSTFEEQAAGTGKKAIAAASACEIAESLLRARSTTKALAYLQSSTVPPSEGDKGHKEIAKVTERLERQRAKRNAKLTVGKASGMGKLALLGISQPALKAGCKLIGVSGPQPGPLRRATLGKHLEQLVEEDAVLAKCGVDSLSREQLAEACLDRGCGSDSLSDAELRQRLESWLKLVHSRERGGGAGAAAYEPHRLRLAAMAACTAAAARDERESLSVLPRLLYG